MVGAGSRLAAAGAVICSWTLVSVVMIQQEDAQTAISSEHMRRILNRITRFLLFSRCSFHELATNAAPQPHCTKKEGSERT